MPRITVLTFEPETIHRKVQSVLFLYLLTQFQSDAQRESYDDFPQVTCLGCNSRACKSSKCLGLYLRKYSETRSEIQAQASSRFQRKWVLISESEPSYKKNYRENSTMTCFIWNSRACKTLTSSDHISANIARQDLKFGLEVQNDCCSNGFFFLTSETS